MTHGAFKCESARHTGSVLRVSAEPWVCRAQPGQSTLRAAQLQNSDAFSICCAVRLANPKRIAIADVPSDRPLVRGQFREEAPRL